MGFLEGKTAIITGAGRAGAEGWEPPAPSATASPPPTPRRARTWSSPAAMSKKLEAAKEELEGLIRHPGADAWQADVNAGGRQRGRWWQNVVEQAVETFGRIRRADQQRPGLGLRRAAGRAHHRAVRSGHLLRPVRHLLLHAGLLPLSEGDSRARVINFASGAGLFGNFGQCGLCCRQGGHPRYVPRRRHRVGQGRHQRQRGLPAGMDGQARSSSRDAYPDAFKANVQDASHGPLRQRWRRRSAVSCVQLAMPDFKYHVRRDLDAGRRHGPATVILLAFHKHMF